MAAPPRAIFWTRAAYSGVVDYEPTELVVTVRCGTSLAELERVLAERGQMLAFEPPHFGEATIGGAIAAGLSGPRRATSGAARDFVLGVRVIDGRGQDLSFRRPGHEERRRLRCLPPHGRLPRHAGADFRDVAEGAAASRCDR